MQRSGFVRLSCALSLAMVVALSQGSVSKAGGIRPLLPNLVVQSPLRILTGCNPYEIVFEGARNCLRFDTVVVNFGRGPLELRYQTTSGARTQQTVQRILTSDGEHFDQPAGDYQLHPTHAHFHYGRMFAANLWAADGKGRVTGHSALRETQKSGFCFYDAQNYWDGSNRSVPRSYSADDCRRAQTDEDDAIIVTGLSRGWMDLYDYEMDGQYIEVSDILPGSYVLEIVIDPDDLIRETDETDNRITLPVRVG